MEKVVAKKDAIKMEKKSTELRRGIIIRRMGQNQKKKMLLYHTMEFHLEHLKSIGYNTGNLVKDSKNFTSWIKD